jgi:hypothetical protein
LQPRLFGSRRKPPTKAGDTPTKQSCQATGEDPSTQC